MHFGQFGVEPSLRGRGIGARLLKHVEDRTRARGFRELALDTAEGATHLVEHYTAHGFRSVARIRWPGKRYDSVVMSKRVALDRGA
jgi:GNAT superfamily N-acetyltransferase